MSKLKQVVSVSWLVTLVAGCSSGGQGDSVPAEALSPPVAASSDGSAAASPIQTAPTMTVAPPATDPTLGVGAVDPMMVPVQQSPVAPTPDVTMPGPTEQEMMAGTAGAPMEAPLELEPFSFFVTSLGAMQMLSGNPEGFGGDLRYGEATGLAGADKICAEVAELSMEGASQKQWRAFLSAAAGGDNGGPVHARDRIGPGPWYDRLGRLVAQNLDDLINQRPSGADPSIINDLPNEYGIPNHLDGADTTSCGSGLDTPCPDNHDVMTGSNEMGMLYNPDASFTCNDWSSSEGDTMMITAGFPGAGGIPGGGGFPGAGGFPGGGFPGGGGGFPGFLAGEGPWCGHSWPRRGSGEHWISALREGGCAPCARVIEMGGPNARCVGAGGGYGGIYCFALAP